MVMICGPARAQTPTGSTSEPKAEAIPEASVPNATSRQAVALMDAKTEKVEIDPAKAVTDPAKADTTPAKAEADPAKDAKAEADQPKEQPPAPKPVPVTACARTINADVVALSQPYMLNRLGASMPNGLTYALRSDVIPIDASRPLAPDNIQLRPGKRARPLVLRANEGDCLKITFTNYINPAVPASTTPPVSLHVQGMQLVSGMTDDGSFVGLNTSSLATPGGPSQIYNLYAQHEGTFLLNTEGDTSTTGQQLLQGLFGAVNVQPKGAEWYRSQISEQDFEKVIDKSKGNNGKTPLGQPIINYNAKDSSGKYLLKMLDDNNNLLYSDLTAIITGPNAGRFPGTTGVGNPEPPCEQPGVDPLFCRNPASPDRKQPYREITVIYHEVTQAAVQAFAPFIKTTGQVPLSVTISGRDNFAINYGTGAIGPEIYANRIGVGPMDNCIDCKYEEFFLTSWAVGDPAMVVDVPANYSPPPPPPPCNPTTLKVAGSSGNCLITVTKDPPPSSSPGALKASIVYYPDDPSNVYHSYLNDHVKFRILHGGTGVSHVHHQHAHQWLQSPNSDESALLDSQMISPGASYTLEMTYNGSGNRNKTAGDSIFHCHFYPHFAAGMWALWRVHDVFEAGTVLTPEGKPAPGSRALPDGEIVAGTPIPAVVPMPTMPMPLMPSPLFIDNGQVVYGTPADPDPTGSKVTENPGFPFFIPGIAGFRPPHPPLDFAPDGAGGFLDGGLPRHVNTGGTPKNEKNFMVDPTDWSKDFKSLNSRQLPEDGTPVERVAMSFFGQRCRLSFLPDGNANNPFGPGNYPECGADASKANFILNGLPRKNTTPGAPFWQQIGAQLGAPYADPAVGDNGQPMGSLRTYKAAAIQMDVKFNDKGWHYPQQRFLTLWQDVLPSIKGTRKPEPLFFRANSDQDYIEYWHTNLVPSYYLVDDFQVRTPTDIIGQHIHLVKFDVTASDGAANGFNYEDGTFSPEEVQDVYKAIKNGGTWDRTQCPACPTDLRPPQPPPSDICSGPSQPHECTTEWMGAQTTIQRWWADPVYDNQGHDRGVRTVFTHDHFSPSTHQQIGLYAGVLVEPKGSSWTSNDGSTTFGTRSDGGPTSWQARIIAGPNGVDSFREFALEYQDFTLAYNPVPYGTSDKDKKALGVSKYQPDWGIPVNPPKFGPGLISTGDIPVPGTQTVNYLNAPTPWRAQGNCDWSRVFESGCVQASNAANPPPPIGDPGTPLLRTYENDKVEVRILVGAHTLAHFFTIDGPKWLYEPSWKNSGYRSSLPTGLSEHFELLFNMPASSIGKSSRRCPEYGGTSTGDCVDYLYSPSNDNYGIANGMWGLMRAYDPTKPFAELKPMPNNPLGPGATLPFQACPANQPASQIRTYNVSAIAAQQTLPNGQIVFNSRGVPSNPTNIIGLSGIMYVFSEDLDSNGKLIGPIEPLILRANAGDCIVVNLTNKIPPDSDIFTDPKRTVQLPKPFSPIVIGNVSTPILVHPSRYIGLHPQLLSYDAATANGINVGYNSKNQTVGYNDKITYNWYAGAIERDQTGALKYTPIELGTLNLLPADLLTQHIWGLYGAMVIEPAGSKWTCDAQDSTGKMIQVPCAPAAGFKPSSVKRYTRASATVTKGDGSNFREFVAMVNEDLSLSSGNTSAINYRTDPTFYRYGNKNPKINPPTVPPNCNPRPPGFASNCNNNCALSNSLGFGPAPATIGEPQTPIFTARVGTPVRFRLPHPQGTGTVQVFTVNGHVWQRNPYVSNSTVMGDNRLSQWMGSHDSHGGTDHFDLFIDKAGGANGVPGDYLYTVFLPAQSNLGSWGVFRVLDSSGKPVSGNPTCVAPTQTGAPAPTPPDDINRFIRQPLNNGEQP